MVFSYSTRSESTRLLCKASRDVRSACRRERSSGDAGFDAFDFSSLINKHSRKSETRNHEILDCLTQNQTEMTAEREMCLPNSAYFVYSAVSKLMALWLGFKDEA